MTWRSVVVALGGAAALAAGFGWAVAADPPKPSATAPAPTSANPAPSPAAGAASGQPRRLAVASKPWKGDFDQMLERRMIRVLVPYSRTLFFNDKGRERGLTADAVRELEQYINQKHETGKRPLTVFLIPTTRDRLLPDLARGLGDIAAGNLTVTPERLRTVDFVVQGSHMVKEVVVSGPKAPPIASLADLSGRTVYVRKSSSYYENLVALNQKKRQQGQKEVALRLVPD